MPPIHRTLAPTAHIRDPGGNMTEPVKMPNYNHLNHAGNFADAVKHSLLCILVQALQRDSTALHCYDSHAGSGLYPLGQQSNGEYRYGIGRLWSATDYPSALTPYFQLINTLNPTALQHYPGSPLLLHQLMRPTDHLYLNDRAPACRQQLNGQFAAAGQVMIDGDDAYTWLQRITPAPAVRQLLFIDPPCTRGTEYIQLVDTLERIGINDTLSLAIWYPLPIDTHWQRFLQRDRQYRQLRFHWLQNASYGGFNGCGMLFINPPRGFRRHYQGPLQWLSRSLSPDKVQMD